MNIKPTVNIEVDDGPVARRPSLLHRAPVGEENVADVAPPVAYLDVGQLDGCLPVLACAVLEQFYSSQVARSYVGVVVLVEDEHLAVPVVLLQKNPTFNVEDPFSPFLKGH